MRIAVDARELSGRPTGVGRYLASLFREWAAPGDAAGPGYLVYAPEPPALPPGLNADVRVLPGPGRTWWEQVRLAAALRRDRPDVLFAPAYSAPLATRVPVVVTIHDVSFLAHPEWFRRRERLRRQWTTRAAARRAQTILTVSEFSRAEIERFLGVAAARIRVIPNGVDPPPGEPRPREVDAGRPLVLFVGSIFNRRRVPDLIAAFGRVAAAVPAARLEIVGENRTFPHQDLAEAARQSGVADRVGIRAYVPESELQALYRQARVFAFLSEYEGFGLTPLEALAHGIPLVVLASPVAREIYRDAALFVHPGDLEGTAAALGTLLEDGPARRAVLAAAPGVLGRYSWPRAARETLTALVEAGEAAAR